MRLERIQAPNGLAPWRVILGLIVPGYSFFATAHLHLGRVIMIAYAAGVLAFFIFLGHPVANLVFGLMLAAHASSIMWLLRLWVDRPPLWLKISMVGTLLALLGGAVYWPGLRYVQERWFLPLSTRSGIVIVQRVATPAEVRPGDIVAYRINADALENIRIREGFGIGRVLGGADARVEFSSHAFSVDGKVHSKKPGMPGQGGFVVPQNHWFLWPDIDIQLNGAATEAMAANALRHVAVVSQNDYVGKPYRRWFGRSQRIP